MFMEAARLQFLLSDLALLPSSILHDHELPNNLTIAVGLETCHVIISLHSCRPLLRSF